MTSVSKPLRWPNRVGAGVGDLRVFAANWLVVPPEEAVARAQRVALRQAIDRCLRAQRDWLDSETRLREAVIERSAEAAATNAEIDRIVAGCEARVGRLRKRLADVSIEIARYFDPLKHPRWPAGDPLSRGGEFSPADDSSAGVVPVTWWRFLRVPRVAPKPSPRSPHAPNAARPPIPETHRRGYLLSEEGGAHGGHTLSRHVNIDDAGLMKRLIDNPGLTAASRWTSQETAEFFTGIMIRGNSGKIASWLRSGTSEHLVLDWRGFARTGSGFVRGEAGLQKMTGARAILVRDGAGYRILTSFPTK